MLHRSFKPAKCKTSLKLAVSRIKLLKNKKDAQVKQIKKELAQLIENGEYRTARIRVEHVVREEKTKAAFELIEIYCEVIAARLPIIESQKQCPEDLKEAVTSVVFASPRCADIPELMDIRKHFTAKYGKEFITAAIEIRPGCGVSRMLIEKLAPKSPDGPTKMKILAAISEEHNVKWNPEAFEETESKPPEDLLNGPNTLGMASRIQVEPLPGPPPPSTTEVPPHNYANPYPRGPPPPSNLQVPPQNYGKHDVSLNINEQNVRSSPRFRDSASSDVSSEKETTSGTIHTERSSGNGTDGMENRHSFPGDGNASSMGRQNWNMNFKDAASAAQAAAESAEMASMAARAAAELSRQHSSESQEKFRQSASSTSGRTSINNDPMVNIHQRTDPQKKSSEPEKRDSRDEVSTNRQSSDTHVYLSEMQTGKKPDSVSYVGDMRSEDKSSRHSSQSGATGEGNTKRQSSNTNVLVSEMQTRMKPDSFSNSGNMKSKEKSSSNSYQSGSTGESRTKRQSSNTNVFASEMQTGPKLDSFSYSGDMRSDEKSSRLSSPSNSSAGSDDEQDVLGRNDQFSYLGDTRAGEQSVRSSSSSHAGNSSNNVGNASDGLGDDSFVSSANIYQSSLDAPLVFDDYYSDDDKCKFDVEDFKGPECSLHFPSPGRNSFSPSADSDVWRSKQQTDELQYKSTSQLSSTSVQLSPPVFLETLTSPMDSSPPKDLLPVAFDASDGPSSDSEDELDKSKFSQSSVSRLSSGQSWSASHRSLGSLSSEEVNVGSDQKRSERSQIVGNSTVSGIKFDHDEFPASQPFPRKVKSGSDSNFKDGFQTAQSPRTMKDSEVAEECSSVSDADNEFNYGTLTGGLRNKGYQHPLYTRKPKSLPVKQVTEDTKIEQPPIVRNSIRSGTSSQDPYNLQGSSKLVKEQSRRTQVPYIASDDDSSEDELSLGTVSSSQEPYNKKLGSEVKASSRSTRGYFDSEDSEVEEDLLTKISTSNARPSARLSRRTQPSSNSVRSSTVASDYGKASLRSSYATETLPKPSSQIRSSEGSGSQEWNKPVESAASKPVPESERSSPFESSRSYRNSSSRSSQASETVPKSFSPTKSSERPGSQERYRQAEEETPKPIPEPKRALPAETSKPYGNPNPSSRSSYAIETQQKPLPQTKSLERPGSQEQNIPVEQAAPKPNAESKKSSPAKEQSSNPPSKFAPPRGTETSKFAPPVKSTETSKFAPPRGSETSKFAPPVKSTETSKFEPPGSTETSKSSGSTVEESPSKEKASHVHPKLPDSDDFIAKFMALRQNRQ